MPLNVTRLREIYEDHVSDEYDINVPVDEDVENFDMTDKVEGLPIIHKLWIHS